MTSETNIADPLAGYAPEAEMARTRKKTQRTLRSERQRGEAHRGRVELAVDAVKQQDVEPHPLPGPTRTAWPGRMEFAAAAR